MDMLILRLRGPLMAFGDVAIDELRPTDVLPTLSQITGLIANALGWTYQDTAQLQRLQDRLSIASRQDRPGAPLRDYQTVHLNSNDMMWRSDGFPSLREGGSSGDFTVQRYRHYRTDSAVTVLVALREPNEQPTLQDLRTALQHPARPLFIGRVSCPPAQPICREPDGNEIVQFASLKEGIQKVPARADLPGCPSNEQLVLAEWPLTPEQAEGITGEDKTHIVERFDSRRWTSNVHGVRRLVYRTEILLSLRKEAAENVFEHDQH